MIDYKQLETANRTIKKVDIKGKEYAQVNDRVKAFRSICPSGSITTEIVSMDGGVVVMKATVTDEEGRILGTGISYEKEGSSFINKTSYIENCETSAVGRALGFAGIGVDGSMASAEEVANAIVQQDDAKRSEIRKETISETKARALEEHLSDNGIAVAMVYDLYKVKKLHELTEAQHMNVLDNLDKIKEMQNGEQGKTA